MPTKAAVTHSNDEPTHIFPAILGHEGTGVVTTISMGPTSQVVGDHIMLLYRQECCECDDCLNPKTNSTPTTHRLLLIWC